jgi:hypothetical protein
MKKDTIAWIDTIHKDKRFIVCEPCLIDHKRSILADAIYTELEDGKKHNTYLCCNHAEIIEGYKSKE